MFVSECLKKLAKIEGKEKALLVKKQTKTKSADLKEQHKD